MQKNEKIELSPIEATAYWWVNLVREKVREMLTLGTSEKSGVEFAEIFYVYTETDWRNLYLQLVQHISLYVHGSDNFSQDTAKGGHDRINEAISKIINRRIPDIGLVGNGVKDSVTYTTDESASVWYKSSGTSKMPSNYDPDYVLTGNQSELDFYNLLISTIAILKQDDSSFSSTPLLRKRFTEEYVKLSDCEESMESVIETFNRAFNKANDRGIVLGRAYSENYLSSFREIDFIGLEPYFDSATHYANVVLQKVIDDEGSHFCKKLKENLK